MTASRLRGSHSRKGNCLDNACMESFFSHLKTEAFAGKPVLNAEQAMAVVEEYIRFYSMERFQKRLGQLSQVEYREKLAT
ncbi:MAG: IS3 family transposase [Desulfocurvibacter africanus]